MIYNLLLFFVVEFIKDGGNYCLEYWVLNENFGKVFIVVCFFVYGVIFIVVMVILYMKVLFKFWRGGICVILLLE